MCPLEGLTNPEPTFLILGRLKKGAPKSESGAVGKDLDYWRAVFKPSRDVDRIEARFREVYGEQPKDINIRLAFDTIRENWDANLEAYKSGVLTAKCAQTAERGYYWLYYRDPQTAQVLVRNGFPVGDAGLAFVQQPVDPSKPVYYTKTKNEPVFMEPLGRLRVVIPEIATLNPPVVGFFEVQLTSPNDIRQVSAELMGIERMAADAGGKISGIPMRLSRMEDQITKNMNGNLTRGTSWMVHISLNGEWATRALQYIERMALPEIIEGEVTDFPQLGSGEPWDEEIGWEESIPPIPQTKTEALKREQETISKVLAREPSEPGCTPKFLVDQGIVSEINHGKALMALLGIPDGAPAEASLERIKAYNAWRKVEGFSRNDKESREKAAAKAIAGEAAPA